MSLLNHEKKGEEDKEHDHNIRGSSSGEDDGLRVKQEHAVYNGNLLLELDRGELIAEEFPNEESAYDVQ
jgi:hypothetical protein